MTRLTLLALVASLTATAHAAPVTYVIDNSHTSTVFEYNHLGFSNQSSRFDKINGKITLDRVARTGSIDITIDAASINTGHDLFDSHLKGEGFFDVAKFPTITYSASTLKFEGDKLVAIEGNLSSKGATKPVTLTISNFQCGTHPFTKKAACGANAIATIKRSDFNNGKYVPLVSDEVTLRIAVEALAE
jgi:polyisoprenoid-binding protein YceI